MLTVTLAHADSQTLDAQALLVPVDGATVIGTAYRIPGDLAVRAQADAIAAAVRVDLHVMWAFRDAALLEVARAAVARLGLAAG